jgi:hypothetical protein
MDQICATWERVALVAGDLVSGRLTSVGLPLRRCVVQMLGAITSGGTLSAPRGGARRVDTADPAVCARRLIKMASVMDVVAAAIAEDAMLVIEESDPSLTDAVNALQGKYEVLRATAAGAGPKPGASAGSAPLTLAAYEQQAQQGAGAPLVPLEAALSAVASGVGSDGRVQVESVLDVAVEVARLSASGQVPPTLGTVSWAHRERGCPADSRGQACAGSGADAVLGRRARG